MMGWLLKLIKQLALNRTQLISTEKDYKLLKRCHYIINFTALFNNMRTLKFKAQPTNAFFATVNQMFSSSQLPTTAERAVIKSNRLDNIVGRWEEPPNSWLAVAKNAFVGWALNFRVRMLLKSAVRPKLQVTERRFCVCSNIYMSFAMSDFHLLWNFNSISDKLGLLVTAAMAPPDQMLCKRSIGSCAAGIKPPTSVWSLPAEPASSCPMAWATAPEAFAPSILWTACKTTRKIRQLIGKSRTELWTQYKKTVYFKSNWKYYRTL